MRIAKTPTASERQFRSAIAPRGKVYIIGRAMFAVLLLLGLFAFGYVVYKFTIYALPCLVGFAAGQFAYATSAGWIGSLIVGAVIALLTFAILRWLYLTAPSPIRWAVAAVFVLTTAAFAYFVFDDISRGNVPSETWRQVLCVFGASVAGLIAFARLREPAEQMT